MSKLKKILCITPMEVETIQELMDKERTKTRTYPIQFLPVRRTKGGLIVLDMEQLYNRLRE